MRTSVIIFISLFFVLPCFAQDAKVQQWKAILSQNKKDTTTLKAMDSLSGWYGNAQTDTGVYYLVKMKELAIELNEKKYIIWALIRTAQEKLTQGKTTEALEEQYIALGLAEELNDSVLISASYNTIGNSHKEYGDYAKSLFFYRKAYKIAMECRSQMHLDYAAMNLGYAYCQLNQLDSALYFEQQAYALSINRRGSSSPAIENNLGNIQYKYGNYAIAKAYYQTSLNKSLLERNGFLGNRSIVNSYLGLANCFKSFNNLDSAIYHAKKALQVSEKITYLKGKRDVSKLLSELFQNKVQIDSAYYYQSMYITTNDSLYNRDKSSSIESLTFEQNLKEQQQQSELQRQKEERSHNIQMAITAIGILTIIILFLLLSRSILVSHKVVEFLSIVVLLMVFEFINLLIHPFLEKVTNHSPALMLLALVAIASLIVPLHHKLEHWSINKLVEKNKAIRLANAKKTIEELEASGKMTDSLK
jgi:tetratricopeptide (TPR) repeat protein